MLRGLVMVVPLCTAGCSLIYNADDLRHDAAPIDSEPADVNPSALTFDAVIPADVQEGVGADNGRPVVFELDGGNIAHDATITAVLDPQGTPTPLTPDAVSISNGGNVAAVALRIPVLGDLADGAIRTLTFTIAQNGASSMTQDVTVHGLDEVTLGGTVAVNSLKPAYSEVTVSTALHLTGTTPAVITVTGGATTSAAIGVDASGTTGGPGGCDGGGGSTPGGCGSQGGRAGADSTLGAGAGGGGGGFGIDGDMGAGAGAGAGGGANGLDMLVPILTTGNAAGNRGAGGGGGGSGTVGLGAGGNGGGGGGVIAIEAGGDVTIGGAITAKGANGDGANGSGGGGSGGGILIRSGGTLGGSGTLDATGGLGGTGSNAGGNGGFGRIRYDAVTGSLAANPPAARGPSWDTATPLIAPDRDLVLTVHGQPSKVFGVALDDAPVDDVTINASGNGTITVHLHGGRNRICIAYGPNTSPNLDKPEARSCLDVGFAPP